VESSEQLSRCSFAVRELVARLETPRCDHGKNETTALTEQLLISARVALADLFGHVGKVEFDRSSATRLEVDEPQPVPRGQHVAGMGLAVQQLLDGAVVDDRSSQVSQCGTEELAVHVAKQRIVAARHQVFSLRDTVREVRTRDIEGPHADVQPL
jgi:hypothetical protein